MAKKILEKEIPQTLTEVTTKPTGECTTLSYIKGKFLGKGGFARVYEIFSENTSQSYACKFICKDKISKSHAKHKLMSEIKIHRSLRHENIVKFFHYFEDEQYIYILLEICGNHSLSEVLRRRKRLSEIEAQSYLYNLISALKYLQAHRVIHRDIKLANVLLTEKMELKLGDFGLATRLEFEGERKRTICGTPNYIAPEILEGKNGHSFECDVWSCGVLLYTMLVGRPPFETKDVKTTYRRIKMNLYNYPENIELSKEAKALIGSILVLDYSKRPSLDEILEHEFFTKSYFPKVLPPSVVAVPPTPGFLKKYGSLKTMNLRASSQENKLEILHSPTMKRASSRESRRFSDSPKEVKASSYTGNDNEGPAIWVTHWIDYSKKYGIGYLLSNNCMGAAFNDNTKIISDPLFANIQYISNDKNSEALISYKITEYPQELFKKVMLLHLFKKHFILNEQPMDSSEPFTHVKKWLITQHATVFRISNKIIQICFRDSTELIMSSESKHVTYVNKEKKTCSYKLGDINERGNKEITKRLKYSKEVLVNMLKNDVRD